MKNRIAIIGGTGLSQGLSDFEAIERHQITTPYGEPSADLLRGCLNLGDGVTQEIIFLSRHGDGHSIAPHHVNYRANIAALELLNVKQIVAVNAVGGLSKCMSPQTIAIPNQIIDYTYGRHNSYFDGVPINGVDNKLRHIDFSFPFTESLRQTLLSAANKLQVKLVAEGVYACTQGPRLETAAEIIKLQRDGCDLVGMTAMPEAVLARELNIEYASVCLVVNWGAGMSQNEITMQEIHANIDVGMDNVQKLLIEFLSTN
jgi:5'-deoxy-5'-methylthioadenosine phosphorylase